MDFLHLPILFAKKRPSSAPEAHDIPGRDNPSGLVSNPKKRNENV
jgi:hypothetical protein